VTDNALVDVNALETATPAKDEITNLMMKHKRSVP